MRGHTFQGEMRSAKISMLTISQIDELETLIRKLVDEKSFQLASQALSWYQEIKERHIVHSILRTMSTNSTIKIIRLVEVNVETK